MTGRNQSILIVDDNPANIQILNETLCASHHIFFATNGLDALAIAETEKPDLILLDIMMPEMDGYEICRRLKEEMRTCEIPVIFVTAMDDVEDEAKGLEMGAVDYIIKPVSAPIVKARVKSHLELVEKSNELKKAYVDLKATQSQMLQNEKMASIGQLAAGVAHEINNPIGFIASNLGSLGKYVDRLTEYIGLLPGAIINESAEELKALRKKFKIDFIVEDAKDLIKESLDGVDRVIKIVQNLKNFSRIDEAECKPADINECLESAANIVWNELKYKATVHKEYGEIPLTQCYPHQLNQVFMNLLLNASQAIDKKGDITCKTWLQEGSIFVAITDTGRGIAQENLNRLFDPFFTTKEIGQGTGLGLSIAYDIIKKHGGEFTVQSEVGRGATFTIKLPVREA